MAKLYFYYSAMNAGKSTILLQSAYNYNERGMETLLFTPSIDQRFGKGKVASRIGLEAEAVSFHQEANLLQATKDYYAAHPKLACVLLDEAQFLTKKQVLQLGEIVDELDLPVLAYGLRSDFRGEPFEGSSYLLVMADNLIEIKTICFCGRKATMNVRVDQSGQAVKEGAQVEIGGNERYVSMCRKHFNEAHGKMASFPSAQVAV